MRYASTKLLLKPAWPQHPGRRELLSFHRARVAGSAARSGRHTRKEPVVSGLRWARWSGSRWKAVDLPLSSFLKAQLCQVKKHRITNFYKDHWKKDLKSLPTILQSGGSEPSSHNPTPSLGSCPRQPCSTSLSAHFEPPSTHFSFWLMLFHVGFLLVPTHLLHRLFPERGLWWVYVLRKADSQHCGLAAGTEIQCGIPWLSGLDF